MPGSTNFLQHNPSANNQLTDSQYSTDTVRSGGAVTGIYASNSFNKLAFQVSTFVAAFAQMMATKGYNVSDANISTLETVLANVMTKSDGAPSSLETGLKIIRGMYNGGTGAVISGSGFTVTHNSTGNNTVNFTVPFSGSPSVCATLISPQNGYAVSAHISSYTNSIAEIASFNGVNTAADINVSFIAIGPN